MSDRTMSYSSQEVQKRDEIKTIVATIDSQQAKYQGILPSNVKWEDFRNSFLIAVQMNPRLLDADRQSLFLALQKAASDGLKPDGREGALVIFGDDREDGEGNRVASAAKGKKKVQWMPMIAGLIKLVRNTGNVAGVRAGLIYRGERIVRTDENGQESYKLVRVIDEHSEIDDSPENIIGAYAVINYKDGFWEMEAMTRRQIDRVRAVSKAQKGPWQSWYDEMARKTVLRRLIKRLDKSAELRRLDSAIQNDDTLPTIDITPETENAPLQVAHEQTVQQEFTKPRETVKAAVKPDTSGRSARQADVKPVPPSSASLLPEEDSQFAGAVDTYVVPSTPVVGSGQPSPIEIWASDEHGEPLDREGPMTTGEFAAWFVDTLATSQNKDGLIEFNSDAIADCRVDKAAFKAIHEAVAEATETRSPLVEQPIKQPRKAIEVPKTPKGAPHWPNYGVLVQAEINDLKDTADIDDWIAVNKPTYHSKTTEIAIENWIDAHKRELGIAPPREKLLQQSPAEIIDGISIKMRTFETDEQITEWASNFNIRAMMAGLRKDDPATFKAVCEVIDGRRIEVSP